jgi:Fe-S-cluster containining protein
MIKPPRLKPRREDVPPGQLLCNYCTAKCCKYIAVAIETPHSPEDFEILRWYVMHDRVAVFVEDDTWYVLVVGDCQHLTNDNRCGIYLTRPKICRDYSTAQCEYEDAWVYDKFFELPAQVDEYSHALFDEPGDPWFRSPRPSLLPILNPVAGGA